MDMCYAMNAFSQFMCEPIHIHMVAAKHILRYARGTIAYGLWYTFSAVAIPHDSGPKDHFQIFFQFGFSDELLVQQEAGLHSPKHCRGRLHC
jgi:hypothetical protein